MHSLALSLATYSHSLSFRFLKIQSTQPSNTKMTPLYPPTHIFNPAPGWYTGDFHAHTNFSDGVHPPDELLALAQKENLDFVSITDHNTIAAHAVIASSPLPIIRGMEMTLKIGHFNVFGVDDWPGWLDEMLPDENKHRMEVDWQDANAMMARCKAEGWLVSINHPLLPPWDWKHPDTLLGYLDALEIWNDPTWPDNAWADPAAVDYWTRLLNDGYRITALGGTDYHYPETKPGAYKPRHQPAPHLRLCRQFISGSGAGRRAKTPRLRQHGRDEAELYCTS